MIVAIAIYLIPTIIAVNDNHPRRGVLFALNLLLGWTLIGWLGALVWAVSNPGTMEPPKPVAVDLDRIERLGRLRADGHITEDEFNTEKSKLLKNGIHRV